MVPRDPATWRARGLDVEVTTECNLGCRYCYLGRPGRDRMSLQTASEVASYLRPFGLTGVLNLYGGEPFLNWPVVQYLVLNTPASATIFTNGATASRDQIRWCLEHGVVAKRSTAGCPEAAALTRDGRYTDDWIICGQWWKDWSATHRLTVVPATARLVCASVAWLRSERYVGPVDLATDDYAEWPPEALAAYDVNVWSLAHDFVVNYHLGVVRHVENFQNFGRAIFGQPGVKVMGCGAGWNTWGVRWDGMVFPCHRFLREPKQNGLCGGRLHDILEGGGPRFGREMAELVDGWARASEREVCRTCEARRACPRGCPHVALKTTGCLDGSPPIRCHTTRLYAAVANWITERLPGERWWEAKTTEERNGP